MSLGLKISKENTKLGRIANISFPQISCRPDVPCRKDCYGNKSYRMYPNTRKAWEGNYEYYTRDRVNFFLNIERWIRKHDSKFFRWFVSGDIPSQSFLDYMSDLAIVLPNTKFLVFTKYHDLDFIGVPNNLQVVLSMWTGWGDISTNSHMRRAWVQTKDNQETRIPEDALSCMGNCETCGMCFYLSKIGKDVFFLLH